MSVLLSAQTEKFRPLNLLVRFRSTRKHDYLTPRKPKREPTPGKPVQEWHEWDGFGPYKYRHHDYPNSTVLRDVNNRRIFTQYAEQKLRYDSIAQATEILPEELRSSATKVVEKDFPPSASIDVVRRCCTITGRPRGIFHQFRLSRFVFRHHADYNRLSGVQRANWKKSIHIDP